MISSQNYVMFLGMIHTIRNYRLSTPTICKKLPPFNKKYYPQILSSTIFRIIICAYLYNVTVWASPVPARQKEHNHISC